MSATTIISTDRQRAIYSKALSDAKKNGMILTPSHLRIEQAITNSKNKYTYTVTKDSNADSVTEKKLDRNDKFIVTHLGLLLLKRTSTKTGQEILQTYPNPVAFPDDSTNFLGADLEVFYNGKLSFTVGQSKWIEDIDTLRFRHVPAAQQAAGSYFAINAAGAEATSSVLAAAQKQAMLANSAFNGENGLIDLTPQIVIDGDQKTEITVEIPIHASHKVANTVANTTNYLVLFTRGFLMTRR